MCDPLTLTSLAVTAAGTGASLYGQSKAQDAYNQVANAQADATRRANEQALALREAERQRQAKYQQQSQAALNASQNANSFETQRQQEAAASQNLAQKYTSSVDPTAAISGIPGMSEGSASGPSVIADAYKSAFGKVGDYLRGQATSKAALDAYSNLSQQNTINNARALQNQSLLGNWMQGSSSALANELAANNENANLAYGNAALAGNDAANQAAIWNGLGSIGMNVGLQGMTPGLSKAFSGKPKTGQLQKID